MRRLERIVQLLFYFLVLVFFVGSIGYNEGSLIPVSISRIILTVILVAIAAVLIKYYFFSKKLK